MLATRTCCILGVVAALCLLPLAGCLDGSGGGAQARPTPGRGTGARPGEPAVVLSGDTERSDVLIPSFGGYSVPATVYRPVEATAERPVPLVLHSHGWSGSRAKAPDAFRDFARAGFGVLSFDERGHGDARATSEAHVLSVDFEMRDVQAVVDYAAGLPWVLQDAEKDPRLGAIGGSYGGGYQLLLAALDPRIDSIVPEITWNNLVQSLAPNGGPKSAWIDLLYGSGNALARVAPEIHQGLAIVDAENRVPDGSVPGEPDLVGQLTRSSPSHYPGAIRIPTLLIQGANDTLFNFNQAVANYDAIRASHAPVGLVTHLQGHILNTRGTIPVPAPVPVGLQGESGPSPCGETRTLSILWHQRYLLGLDVDTGPKVCLALEDASFVSGAKYPLPGAQSVHAPVGVDVSLLQGASQAVRAQILAPTTETTLVGIPLLKGKVSSVGPDAIVYWTLEAQRPDGTTRLLNAQVTPQRIGGPVSASDFTLPLMGIGARLGPGESLQLVASTQQAQYAHNFGRVPGQVTFSQLGVELPVLSR